MSETRNLLAGKAVLVTGAGRGIGRAIALGVAAAGGTVAVNYHRDAASANEVAEYIRGLGREAAVIQADTRDRGQVLRMIEETEARLGGLDVLVNNAGVSAATPFLSISEEEWDRVINTNLKGYFLVAQAAANVMIRHGKGGRIINISSARQEQAWPGNAHYCASKGGIHMLTRVMALELGRHGLTVNCVSPGTILTDINRKKFSDEDFLARRIERIPVGRLGDPADVVGAVILLASNESTFINGASIMVDGGQTVW
ncbi:MAG: 3-oxoacyl-ACP reductase FabG [Hyphomicrobiaceae bacterium]|nr:3-oxoacyl-ACP reductase FabG [Hyphomicrobiaceae bacterium]